MRSLPAQEGAHTLNRIQRVDGLHPVPGVLGRSTAVWGAPVSISVSSVASPTCTRVQGLPARVQRGPERQIRPGGR